MADQDDQKEIPTLSDKISFLENYAADLLLSGDLKEIYAQVQIQCEDFRNNIFFKNLEYLEEKLGSFDKTRISHTFAMSNIDQILKDIKLPSALMEIYTRRAQKIN